MMIVSPVLGAVIRLKDVDRLRWDADADAVPLNKVEGGERVSSHCSDKMGAVAGDDDSRIEE